MSFAAKCGFTPGEEYSWGGALIVLCEQHAPIYDTAKRTPPHAADEDCTLDPTGWHCIVCGTSHGDPDAEACECGGRGFHRNGCRKSDATGEAA